MMKKNVHLLVLAMLLLGACSKNKQDLPAKEKRIAAVFVNDTLLERYYYRPDNQIARYETYKPDGSPERVWKYNYDASGVLSSINGALPDGTPKTEHVFQKDASGRIERSRFINYGIFAQDSKYEYDDAVPGRVIRIRDYDTTGTPTLVREFVWSNNVLSSSKVYEVNGAALELLNEYNFSLVADQQLLNRYLETMNSLASPVPDNWLVYAVSSQVLYKNYAGGLLNYHRVADCVNRVTDGNKYTQYVDYVIHSIQPAQPDQLSRYRYEYVD